MRVVFVFLFIVAIISGFSQNGEVAIVMVPTGDVSCMKLIECADNKTITDKNILEIAKTLGADHSKNQTKILFKSI